MKPMKMKRYVDFNEYLRDQIPGDQATLRRLRAFVKKKAPQLQESVKWGNGCWLKGDVPVCYVHTGPGFVQFGFFRGSSLNDPKGLLSGSGKFVRYIKLNQAAEIDQKATAGLLRQALR